MSAMRGGLGSAADRLLVAESCRCSSISDSSRGLKSLRIEAAPREAPIELFRVITEFPPQLLAQHLTYKGNFVIDGLACRPPTFKFDTGHSHT